MNDKEIELTEYIKKSNFVETYNILFTCYYTIFTISTIGITVLQFLNENNFPVIYSDTDGIIIVKFQ
jgi:hypothetical protein